MKRYPWPGNVRELENLVRRLAALYPQDEISAEIIDAELKTGERPRRCRRTLLPDDLSIGQAVEHYPAALFRARSAATCRRPASTSASWPRSNIR